MAGNRKPKKKKNAVNLQAPTKNLDKTLKKQWILKAIELFQDGYANSYVRDFVRKNKEGSKSDHAVNAILSEANAAIVTSQFNKAEEIIPLHISRYNRITKTMLAVEDGDDLIDRGVKVEAKEYWFLREKKVRAYNDAVDTNFSKERLLQYHNKGFTLILNHEETVEINEVQSTFNVDKLSFEVQLELYELFKIARKDENQLLAIIQRNENAEKTVDVEHVVVERPNVEQIEHQKLPEGPRQAVLTSSDPTIKLKENLRKAAAMRFRDAGGTLTEEEEKLIK